MKNVVRMALSLIVVSVFYGCGFLDVEPYDSVPAEEVFTSKKGLQAAMTGAYSQLQRASVSTDAIVFADLAADNFISRGSKAQYQEVSSNTIQASNTYIEALWNRSYEGIGYVNNIIAGIDGVRDITPEEKEDYLGQCHFLRAFHYLNLQRYFGRIPLRLQPVKDASALSLNIPLSEIPLVYQQIISDLLMAEGFFEGKGKANPAFVSEGAIKALLAKVYLYTGNWQAAIDKANEVTEMGYEMELENYAKIFDEKAVSNEIIFLIDFANSNDVQNIMNDWLTPDGRFEVAVWKNAARTATVADDFEQGDLRKEITVRYYTGPKGNDYYCAKYMDNISRRDNIVILRLAEMFLIKAEALNETGYIPDGEAFDALNFIRSRAGLTPYTSADLINQQDFRLALEKERNFELMFEGNRLFDLRRTARINEVLPDIGTLKEAGWYFPIPQSEIDTNDSIN